MKNSLISVIIPIYKVEEYLERCIASVVNQTYRNLEIILVDDGSPDRCPALCDSWSKKDHRIIVIHKSNGGLSDARNAGMRIASGEYIGFIDGDDYISPDMYELLYNRMVEDSSDIVACGVNMVWDDGNQPKRMTRSGDIVLNHYEAMEACINESWIIPPVWNKLYRAALIKDIVFPVGKYHEDVFWTWKVIAKAQKVSCFDQPCYFYVQRSSSIMSETYSIKRLDAIEAKEERLEYLINSNEEHSLISNAKINLFFSSLYHGQLALNSCSEDNIEYVIAFLKKEVKKYPLRHSELKKLSVRSRIWYWLSRISFLMTCQLRNSLKVGY